MEGIYRKMKSEELLDMGITLSDKDRIDIEASQSQQAKTVI